MKQVVNTGKDLAALANLRIDNGASVERQALVQCPKRRKSGISNVRPADLADFQIGEELTGPAGSSRQQPAGDFLRRKWSYRRQRLAQHKCSSPPDENRT